MLVSCKNTKDVNNFEFPLFEKWLKKNIPIMPSKGSGFKLPRQTAKQNRDKYYTTVDRVNGVTTELRKSKEPLKVLDFSCGDPFYNIREENKKFLSPVN